MVSFDQGYKTVVGSASIHKWLLDFKKSLTLGGTQHVAQAKHKGKTSYMDCVEERDPSYLHRMYRYATNILGDSATFEEIARLMAEKSSAEDAHETLELNRRKVWRWFKKQGRKEKSSYLEKPYLTEERKQDRMEWATTMQRLLTNNQIIVHLDEKWFYTTSRRCTYKYLPRAGFEAEGVDCIHVRKVICRRHPAKCMLMAAVTKPIQEHNFDGKIYIKRVAIQKTLTRASYSKCFHISRLVNNQLKDGDWRHLYLPNDNFNFGEFKMLIAENFELDDDVGEQLEFRYVTYDHFNGDGSQKKRYLDLVDNDVLEGKRRTNHEGIDVALTLEDIQLFRKLDAGREVETDISCDSAFMRQTMPEVGEAIRQTMPWIPQAQPIYLQMDNAGGHGTNATRREYTELLFQRFNIIVHHQSPRSPETNALNLGLWNSLQSVVEKLHRDKRTDADAIAHSALQAWRDLPSNKISRVFSRIPIVLDLIIEDQGGNDKVEGRRGRLIEAP